MAAPCDIYRKYYICKVLYSGSAMIDVSQLEERAHEVATMLRALANERRLILLCRLAEVGEASVGALAEATGLGQPIVSQQLAVLREEGLVAHRREGQSLHYRIDDARVETLLKACQAAFCPPD